tara:strand:- start:626 stop:1414 length:789 start_codon:yes stop_codon:yes gene_type:complete
VKSVPTERFHRLARLHAIRVKEIVSPNQIKRGVTDVRLDKSWTKAMFAFHVTRERMHNREHRHAALAARGNPRRKEQSRAPIARLANFLKKIPLRAPPVMRGNIHNRERSHAAPAALGNSRRKEQSRAPIAMLANFLEEIPLRAPPVMRENIQNRERSHAAPAALGNPRRQEQSRAPIARLANFLEEIPLRAPTVPPMKTLFHRGRLFVSVRLVTPEMVPNARNASRERGRRKFLMPHAKNVQTARILNQGLRHQQTASKGN